MPAISVSIPIPAATGAHSPPPRSETLPPAELVSVRDSAVHRLNMDSILEAARPAEGIFSAAVDHAGQPTTRIDNKTKYEITGPNGSKFVISAANAVMQGYLVKNQDGSFSDPKARPTQPEGTLEGPNEDPKTPEDTVDPLAPPPLDPENDQLESAIHDDLKADGFEPLQAVAQLVSSDFKITPDLMKFAAKRGVSAEEFRANLVTLHNAHQSRVESYFRARGVEPAEVFEFEKTQRTRSQALAGRLNTLQGSFAYWTNLTNDFRNIKGR